MRRSALCAPLALLLLGAAPQRGRAAPCCNGFAGAACSVALPINLINASLAPSGALTASTATSALNYFSGEGSDAYFALELPQAAAAVTLTTCHPATAFDTLLAAYSLLAGDDTGAPVGLGASPYELQYSDDVSSVCLYEPTQPGYCAPDSTAPSVQSCRASALTLAAPLPPTLYIVVDALSTVSGGFGLAWSVATLPSPPAAALTAVPTAAGCAPLPPFLPLGTTRTASASRSPTATRSPSGTPSFTPSVSRTPSGTRRGTASPLPTPCISATPSNTRSTSATRTPTPSSTPSPTPSPTLSRSRSHTPSHSRTPAPPASAPTFVMTSWQQYVPLALAAGGSDACAVDGAGAVRCISGATGNLAYGDSPLVALAGATGSGGPGLFFARAASGAWSGGFGRDAAAAAAAGVAPPLGAPLTTLSIGAGCLAARNGSAGAFAAGEGAHCSAAPVAGLNVTYLAAATASTCAIVGEEGEVRCWGSAPAAGAPPSAGQVLVVPGGPAAAAYALNASGALSCWGSAAACAAAPSVPLRLVQSDDGGTLACGIDASYALVCWGAGASGAAPPAGAHRAEIRG